MKKAEIGMFAAMTLKHFFLVLLVCNCKVENSNFWFELCFFMCISLRVTYYYSDVGHTKIKVDAAVPVTSFK
jgi:hypothetical protein